MFLFLFNTVEFDLNNIELLFLIILSSYNKGLFINQFTLLNYFALVQGYLNSQSIQSIY